MDHSLKCQLCGQKLRVNPNCTCSLGEHLLAQHPDIELTYFSSFENLACCQCDYWKQKGKVQENRKVADSNRKVISYRKPSSIKVTRKRKTGFNKTTVETWKPAQIELVCPRCRKRCSPTMRNRKNVITDSSLGTCCMLSCWPICFLPFMLQRRSSTVDLYCKHCSTFLGEYNRATGVLSCLCNKWDCF